MLLNTRNFFAFMSLKNFVCVCISDISLYFSSAVFFWIWYPSYVNLIKWVEKHPLLFYFLEEIVQNGCQLFFKCLVKFSSDTSWLERFWFLVLFQREFICAHKNKWEVWRVWGLSSHYIRLCMFHTRPWSHERSHCVLVTQKALSKYWKCICSAQEEGWKLERA